MRVFKAFLFLSFCFSYAFVFAQERGKPNLDAYASVLAAAKKNDKAAMLKIADICVGKFYDGWAVKDFKAADKWYQKILKNPDTLNKYAYFKLFQIHLLGGSGLKDKNLQKAKQFHQLHCENFPSVMYYDDAKDLDLRNFFKYYDNYANLAPEEICELARFYHEFNISFGKAIALLEQAEAKGSENAKYLKTKWTMQRDYFRTREKKKLPIEKEKEAYEDLAKRMYDVSSQAAVDFVHMSMSPDHKKINIRAQRVEELLMPIADTADSEMKFKLLSVIFLVKKGKERLEIAQKMASLDVPDALRKRDFALEPTALFEEFAQKSETVAGLFDFLRTYDDIPSLPPINTVEYRRSFGGKFTPLLNLALILDQKENRKLIGDKFTAKYHAEILKKTEANLSAQASAYPVFKLCNTLEGDENLRRIFPDLKKKALEKLSSFNLDAQDSIVLTEKFKIDNIKFKNFEDGRALFLALQKEYAPKTVRENGRNVVKEVLSKDNLSQIMVFLKTKVIQDLYGRNPKLEEIEKMKTAIYQNKWLLPEGEDVYWQYTQDSESWFTGKVLLPEVAYHYEVKNRNGEWTVEIKSVKDAQSNLVYRTQLVIRDFIEDEQGEMIVVNVRKAKYEKYKWKSSELDFLSVMYKQNSPLLIAEARGNMPKSNSVISDDLLLAKEEPADFSHKTAVRSAIRYFILAYHHALGM
jgi:hypothetical protein